MLVYSEKCSTFVEQNKANNMEKKQLEVGDMVYEYRHGTICVRHKIERVTKTKAISGVLEFRRFTEWGDRIIRIGASGYSSTSYTIETEKAKQDFEREVQNKQLFKAIEKLRSVAEKLTTDELNEIANFIYKKTESK